MDQLAKKKEEIISTETEKTESEEVSPDSDVDDEEFEDFLDWRTKKAWK